MKDFAQMKAITPPGLPSTSLYNEVRTLPNKFMYDYGRRVARRRMDVYDTQSSRFLPSSSSTRSTSFLSNIFSDSRSIPAANIQQQPYLDVLVEGDTLRSQADDVEMREKSRGTERSWEDRKRNEEFIPDKSPDELNQGM